MAILTVNSRDLPNTWRLLDDKIGGFRNRGLPFRFPYVGAFSQALAEWFIRVYSNPGDTIFEPFAGRGTSMMQALWSDRNVIANDLSPYSNVLCHSVMWTPYMKDVLEYLNILESYVTGPNCKISVDYAGKGTTDDIAKIYDSNTFSEMIKLRNILNNHDVLLGRGYDLFGDIDLQKDDSLKKSYEYRHEIVMFCRMVLSQIILHNSENISLNGVKTRSSDNTNIRSLLKYYDKIGEYPRYINVFDSMRQYIAKMDLDSIGIRDKFLGLNKTLISCDARKLDLPDKCVDFIITSPPYFDILNYGMANWLRLWLVNNIGDPLVKSRVPSNIEIAKTSEIHGKIYDKVTDSTGGTVANPMSYSAFTGQYLRELYRILKDDACAVIVVGDYGNKRKIDAWRLVADRASIFGFSTKMVIMDELNKSTKSSSQFQSKFDGGKNDYDVAVVLYKGNYEMKNNPEDIDFRWRSKFVDDKQKDIESAWG